MQLQVDFDDKGFRKRFKDFESAHKIAARNTLNIAAASTRKKAIATIKSEFTLRNTWTVRNIAFEPVSNINKGKMMSHVGARPGADYLADQHTGGMRPKYIPPGTPEANAVWVPTAHARGGSTNKPKLRRYRQQTVARKLIRTTGGRHKGTKKSEMVARMWVAEKKKLYFVGHRQITEISHIERRSRGKIRVRSKILYKLEKNPMRISPVKWLYPNAVKTSDKMPDIYVSQLSKLWGEGTVF